MNETAPNTLARTSPTGVAAPGAAWGRWASCAVLIAACGGAPARPAGSSSSSGGPGWARGGDRSDSDGSVFVCEGEGSTEDAARTAAQGVCNDKVCKLCGVEVESVVQTTETLKGIEMQRSVVERCRRVRRGDPQVLHKSIDCGPGGCVAWLSVAFSKEDEKRECSSYTAEHFADPAECRRTIEAFRTTPGRDAASFRARARLLDDALAACKYIDVRPTPLVDSLHEQLFAGMDEFEFTPGKQQERREQPFFETTWYHSRTDMMNDRRAADAYLTTYEPLRQRIRETPTLVGRIALVRDYVRDRSTVFDVVEATEASDLDSKTGVARLLAALEASPLGGHYGSVDVHFGSLYALADVHVDLSAVTRFYTASYPPEALSWAQGIPLTTLLAKDGKIDEADWSYVFTLHTKNDCGVCVLKLLDTTDHGGPAVRDARYLAFLRAGLAKARSPRDRLRFVAEYMPHDPAYMLHATTLLPPDLKPALDWDFYLRRLEVASAADDAAAVSQILPLLGASLGATPASTVSEPYCDSLGDRLQVLASKGGTFPSVGDQVCACLTGPMAGQGTRSLVNKSTLYDEALARSLPCVRPE